MCFHDDFGVQKMSLKYSINASGVRDDWSLCMLALSCGI